MIHELVSLGLCTGLAVGLLAPRPAAAFCGFYVGGANAKLFNDATVVVLMRDGRRTVVSMQNAYQGPLEDFALVVPVPVVLREGDVKTLRREVFDRVDTLAAPRLVEYWEQDPCGRDSEPMYKRERRIAVDPDAAGAGELGAGRVKVEARFAVAEYEVVILSARESDALEAWLHENGYAIPDGAESMLRPYVAEGMKFFVAKVDPSKVEFSPEGRAMLSPLRFHYDSDEFSLPVRLGLINAPAGEGGKQDLLVHILAPDLRYEAANYPNVTIKTNLVVDARTKDDFGGFYAALFDQLVEQNS